MLRIGDVVCELDLHPVFLKRQIRFETSLMHVTCISDACRNSNSSLFFFLVLEGCITTYKEIRRAKKIHLNYPTQMEIHDDNRIDMCYFKTISRTIISNDHPLGQAIYRLSLLLRSAMICTMRMNMLIKSNSRLMLSLTTSRLTRPRSAMRAWYRIF